SVQANQDARGQNLPAFFEGAFPGEPNFALRQLANQLAGLGEPGRAYLVGTASLRDVGRTLGIGSTRGVMLVLQPLTVSTQHGSTVFNDAVPRTLVSTDGDVTSASPVLMAEGARRAVVRFDIPRGMRSIEVTMPNDS